MLPNDSLELLLIVVRKIDLDNPFKEILCSSIVTFRKGSIEGRLLKALTSEVYDGSKTRTMIAETFISSGEKESLGDGKGAIWMDRTN